MGFFPIMFHTGLGLLLFASLLPAPSGLRGQSLPALRSIDQYLAGVHRQGGAPGFAVVVVKDGRVVFEKGYGVEVAGRPRPMTPQTVSAAGSLTKSMTALAMMQLAEQGKVRLDDPVVRYLPWFRTANRERSDRITVRMLLNNTSGLREGHSPVTGDVSDRAVEQLVRSLASVYLVDEPGTAYAYSNVGFSVAGLIIHRVTGMPYIDYLERYIFRPLEMSRTTSDPVRFAELRSLYGHHFGIYGGIPANREPESGEYIPAGLLLRTTAHDLGNYLIMLLNEGTFRGRRLLSTAGVRELSAPAIAFPGLEEEQGGSGEVYHYGLGWISAGVNGRSMVFHGGSTGTMSSWMLFDPARKTGAAILLNLDYSFIDRHRYPTHFTILANTLQLLDGETPTGYGVPRTGDPTRNDYELPGRLRPRYLGRYRIADAGRAFVFRGGYLDISQDAEGRLLGRILRRGQCLQEFRLDFVSPLSAVSRNLAKAESITFHSDLQGRITGGYYFGMRLVRERPDDPARQRLTEAPDGSFSFVLPPSWTVAWKPDRTFTATSAEAPGCRLTGSWFPLEMDAQSLLRRHFPGDPLLAPGTVQTELIGPSLWTQQSFATRQGQHAVHYADTGGRRFMLLLTAPPGQLTRQTQAVLLPLLQSWQFHSGF